MNIEKERDAFEQNYAVINGLSGSLIKSAFEKIGTEYVNLQTKRAFDLWLASTIRASEKLKGCVVVPVEPTDLMINAYRDNSVAPVSTLSIFGYKAMIEAARGGK